MKSLNLSLEVTRGEQELYRLTVSINEEHRNTLECAGRSLTHARAAGAQLLKAKRIVGKHGNWGAWLTANLEFAKRTAQAYMRIARRWNELEEKANAQYAQGVAFLGIQKAMNLLANSKPERLPTVPSQIRPEVANKEFKAVGVQSRSTAKPNDQLPKLAHSDVDEPAPTSIEPDRQPALKSTDDIQDFKEGFGVAVDKICGLARKAKKIPKGYEMIDSFREHLCKLEKAVDQLRKILREELE